MIKLFDSSIALFGLIMNNISCRGLIKKALPLLAFSPVVFSAIQEVPFQGEEGTSYFTRLGITAFLRYDDSTLLPQQLGVRIPAAGLDALLGEDDEGYDPDENENDGLLCNRDGECAAGFRYFIDLTRSEIPIPNMPFRFFQVNFNPEGYSRRVRNGGNNPTATQNSQEANQLLGRALIGFHGYAGVSMDTIKGINSGVSTYEIAFRNGMRTETANLDEESIVKVRNLPTGSRIPSRYVNVDVPAAQTPMMGTHWYDRQAFGNNPSTETNSGPRDDLALFWLSYDGHFVAIEPVIFKTTIDRLRNQCFRVPIPTPPAPRNGSMGVQDNMVTPEPSPMPEACQKRCYSVRRGSQMAEGGQYPSEYCYQITETNLEVTFESFSRVEGYRDNLNGMSLPARQIPDEASSSLASSVSSYMMTFVLAAFGYAGIR